MSNKPLTATEIRKRGRELNKRFKDFRNPFEDFVLKPLIDRLERILKTKNEQRTAKTTE